MKWLSFDMNTNSRQVNEIVVESIEAILYSHEHGKLGTYLENRVGNLSVLSMFKLQCLDSNLK